MPRPDHFVAETQKHRHALVDPPVVLGEERDVVGMAVERSTVGNLVTDVSGYSEEEVGKGVAGRTHAAEAILSAEIDAESKPIACGVLGPETTAFQGVA